MPCLTDGLLTPLLTKTVTKALTLIVRNHLSEHARLLDLVCSRWKKLRVSARFPKPCLNHRRGTALDERVVTNRALRLDQRDKAGGANKEKTSLSLQGAN